MIKIVANPSLAASPMLMWSNTVLGMLILMSVLMASSFLLQCASGVNSLTSWSPLVRYLCFLSSLCIITADVLSRDQGQGPESSKNKKGCSECESSQADKVGMRHGNREENGQQCNG
jgi:hypothetical protein